MAGLADTNVVDLVAQDSAGRVLVIMVETRSWREDPNQPSQLREKLNAYADFILNGGLAQRFPETAGQPVDIQLDCTEAPTEQIKAIIDHGADGLRRLGIGFRLKVRGTD
jgi:hypothetical protein